MASAGSVRVFHAEEGWGVIDGPDVPGGCWVHFSAIAVDGYRTLERGQHVTFRAEAVRQDGFAYRAVQVWTGDVEPGTVRDSTADHVEPGTVRGSTAYRSVINLTFDQPGRDDPGAGAGHTVEPSGPHG